MIFLRVLKDKFPEKNVGRIAWNYFINYPYQSEEYNVKGHCSKKSL